MTNPSTTPEFDIEHFVFSGQLGPFDRSSSRDEIERLLGKPDPRTVYPDFVASLRL